MTTKYWLRTKFPCIVKSTGKYNANYYIANDKEELCRIFYEIFENNRAMGYYYSLDADEHIWYSAIKEADEITEHFRELWDLLMGRAGYEYEKVEIIIPDKF